MNTTRLAGQQEAIMAQYRSSTRGNLAYSMEHGNGAAAEPEIRTAPRPRPQLVPGSGTTARERRRVRQREHRRAMARIKVREQEAVAPLSIIGFLAVAVMAVIVLTFYVQLNAINKQVVEVSRQLTQLQAEEKVLTAEYEQMYDMQEIENDMVSTGKMVRPDSTQVIYLELTEEDSAQVFHQEEGLFERLWDRFSSLME